MHSTEECECVPYGILEEAYQVPSLMSLYHILTQATQCYPSLVLPFCVLLPSFFSNVRGAVSASV